MLRVLFFFSVILFNFFPVNHRSAVTSAGQPEDVTSPHRPASRSSAGLAGLLRLLQVRECAGGGSVLPLGGGHLLAMRQALCSGSVLRLCQAHHKPLVPAQWSDQTLWLLTDSSRCFGTGGALSSPTRRVRGSFVWHLWAPPVCRGNHPQVATGSWHLATGPGASLATSPARTPH